MPDKEVEIVAVGAGTVNASNQSTGSLNGGSSFTGSLNGTIDDTSKLGGSLNVGSNANANLQLSGMLSAVDVTRGAAGATLTLRVGQDGIDGKDGFSPTITVEKDTPTEYILRVTDVNGSYLTPNLYPDLDGLQDIQALVAGKVDEDLLEYPVIKPTLLNTDQRKNSFLYTNAVGLNRKIALDEVALTEEVNEKIRRKIQTVENIPEKDEWGKGDYIFLDIEPRSIIVEKTEDEE